MKRIQVFAAMAALVLGLAAPSVAQPGFPYAIGASKDFSWGVVIGGGSTFTPMGTPGGGLKVVPSIKLPSGQTGEGMRVLPAFNTFATGTHANLTGVFVGTNAITSTGATITNSTNLKIDVAASAATNNYSLWVLGAERHDGAQSFTATTNQLALGTTNVTTFSAASPAASATVDLSTVAGGYASSSTCGTTTTCTAAAATANVITKFGTVALTSASPSTAVVTGLPYTSTSSYVCTASPEGTTAAIAATGVAVSRTSASSLTLTGPNSVTTVMHYVCTGT